MRACVASHMFEQTGEDSYAHKHYSRIFAKPGARDLLKLMYDAGGKGTYFIQEFLESTGWRNPDGSEHSAFQFRAKTELLPATGSTLIPKA
jgi:hypothetical protein